MTVEMLVERLTSQYGIDRSRIVIVPYGGIEIQFSHESLRAVNLHYKRSELLSDANTLNESETDSARTRWAVTKHVELIGGTFAITLHDGKVANVTIKEHGVNEAKLFEQLDRIAARPIPSALQRFNERPRRPYTGDCFTPHDAEQLKRDFDLMTAFDPDWLRKGSRV